MVMSGLDRTIPRLLQKNRVVEKKRKKEKQHLHTNIYLISSSFSKHSLFH